MAAKRTTTPGFKDDRYRTLIRCLVEARKNLKMTQQELADQLGLHKQFVSRVELGERRVDAIEFADIAMALGLSPGTLLDKICTPDTSRESEKQ